MKFSKCFLFKSRISLFPFNPDYG